MPAEYERLRQAIAGLVDELDTVSEAEKNFEIKDVRQALNKLIELVIGAAQEVSEYYSRSKPGEL